MARRTRVFVSYSRKDSEWLDRLHIHLKPLVRNNTLDVWSDGRICPGGNRKREIEVAISRARAAILLISADFLASDFIIENELPPLLEKAEKDGAVILPIVIGPCRFVETQEISRYQSVNDPLWPLISLPKFEQENIFVKLTRAIEQVENLPDPSKTITAANSTLVPSSVCVNEPRIKVFGVGGGGCNAVQNMAESGLQEIELVSINSDVQALKGLTKHNKLQIGHSTTRGLGAGANPEVGRASAIESTETIRKVIGSTNLLFITAGMGGGTGTGAAPNGAKLSTRLFNNSDLCDPFASRDAPAPGETRWNLAESSGPSLIFQKLGSRSERKLLISLRVTLT